MTDITPFTVHVPEADLDDLVSRLEGTRWAQPDPNGDWSRGVPLDYLKQLAGYWATGFDWRAQEATLNRLPQFTTTIDGQTIHFVHLRSSQPNAMPLLLCHGWPGSFVEYQKIVPPLAEPLAHGAAAADAFDVIIPSLPGFGFSTPLSDAGWTVARIAEAYATLMEQLGYRRYGAHGTDIGSGIISHLASHYPDRLIGMHVGSDRMGLNYVGAFLPMPKDLSEAEIAELNAIKAKGRDGDGYFRQQSTKPQTLAYGLGDSPVGQLAWIVEKFREWTDPARSLPEQAVDRDQLLANVALYWFTNTGGSSAQFYWESMHSAAGWTAPSSVPTGWAVFHAHPLVRRIMDPQHRIAHWTECPSGGHFPAMEEPEFLTADIRDFFRSLRSGPSAD
jgi:pimeloyl-ACP methyl ester carboxylesterase